VTPERGSSCSCHARSSHPSRRDARKPAIVVAAAPGTELPRFDGLRILIVDDDRESCEMMLEALRSRAARARRSRVSARSRQALTNIWPNPLISRHSRLPSRRFRPPPTGNASRRADHPPAASIMCASPRATRDRNGRKKARISSTSNSCGRAPFRAQSRLDDRSSQTGAAKSLGISIR